MQALFDVNVLIALFDPAHTYHEQAHTWFHAHQQYGWATCPITQNGCVRILSQPKYPNAITVAEAVRRLGQAMSGENHEVWHDDISIVDTRHFDSSRIGGPGQITDLYLLGLAVRHQGRLVSFDRGISTTSVMGAGAHHLVVL